MELWSESVYVFVGPYNIAYLKFILEGFDNLAYISIIDNREGVVKIVFSKDYKEEVMEIVCAFEKEIGLKWVSI